MGYIIHGVLVLCFTVSMFRCIVMSTHQVREKEPGKHFHYLYTHTLLPKVSGKKVICLTAIINHVRAIIVEET